MENLNTKILGRLSLSLPPLSEQQRVVKFLFKEAEHVMHSIKITEREIELIKEFRTTLISDVVTGKIDVRTAIREETPV